MSAKTKRTAKPSAPREREVFDALLVELRRAVRTREQLHVSSWHLFRDGGEWSGYEGGAAWQPQFRSSARARRSRRRSGGCRRGTWKGAQVALAIAERRVREAEERFGAPVKIRALGEGSKKST